jgi:4-hydroxybutyrate CoA-transferase
MANDLAGSGSGSSPWSSQYRRALDAGNGWLTRIQPGDHIFVGSACGEPTDLIEQLVQGVREGRLRNLTVYQMLRSGVRHLLDAAGPDLHLVGIHFHAELAEVVEKGHGSFLPIGIHQIARNLEEGRIKFDVALVQVSRPDENGHLSLGVSVDFAAQAVRLSHLVVAQVNDRSPRTLGDCSIHASEVDAAIEVSHEIGEIGFEPADEGARQIARLVLDLIPDRSTVEMGIGAVMTSILEGLSERVDLGLHTGLIIEPMMDLIESGVITNRWKGIDREVSVANQCRGTRRLYDFLNNNPAVSMRPAGYTHDPRVLGSLRNFRAINSAIEVDLLGQVNSEFVAGRRVSSTGGLSDFVRSCQTTEGARSIIALRSTAGRGKHSRIVPNLGAAVTLTADLADIVVTENGTADLRGMRSDERAAAMIEIAHPSFRDQLGAASSSRASR